MEDIYLRDIGKKLADKAESTGANDSEHGLIDITELVREYDDIYYQIRFHLGLKRTDLRVLVLRSDVDDFMSDDEAAFYRIMEIIQDRIKPQQE